MVQNGRLAPLYPARPIVNQQAHPHATGKQNEMITAREGGKKNLALVSTRVIQGGNESEEGKGNSSDSSLDTLTSSSGDESEDEKMTILVDSRSRSSGKSGDLNSSSTRQPCDAWISGTRLALNRQTDDPVEIEEEWLDYLHKNIKVLFWNFFKFGNFLETANLLACFLRK